MESDTFPQLTFHAHKKYWAGWAIITFFALPFLLFVIIGMSLSMGIDTGYLPSIIVLGGLALLVSISFIFSYKRAWPFPWKIKLTVSETAVSGFNGTIKLNVTWDELIFLHYEKQKNTHWLFLATQEEDIHFSLDHLPATAVWQALEKQANPAILKDSGSQKVNERDKIKAQEIVENVELPLVVKPRRFFQWGFTLSLFVFIVMSTIFWYQKLWGGIIIFLLPSLIIIYFLLQLGSIKIDETSIHYFPWKRHYQIQWDNITQIETDQQGGIIVFQGTQQQLAIPGFSAYQQQGSVLMAHLLDAQINQRQLPLHRTWKANFKRQKYTKVKT